MALDTSEIRHLLELLDPLGPLQSRRMFGGWGIYAAGLIFAIVIDGELLLKVDDATRALRRRRLPPLYLPRLGREMPMRYWSVPEDALDSAEAMRPWAVMAREAAARKASAKPVRKWAGKRAKISKAT